MNRIPNSSHHFLSFISVIAFSFLIPACYAPPNPTTPPPLPSSTNRKTTATPKPTPTVQDPSPVSIGLATITLTPSPLHPPTLTPTPIAPQFSLSSRPQPPNSSWRPPIYPVPWAPNSNDHFYFYRPVNGTDVEYPNANYSYGNVFFDDVVHTGIDIPGDMGTPIYAAGDGKVIWAGYGYYRAGSNILDDPYGKAVAIRHNFGYRNQHLFTVYAHLDEISVREGQTVEAGDQIGLMGETGRTTGPHLHFEVRVKEDDYFATRNPYLWLAPPQGWGLLVGQIRNWNGRLLEDQQVNLYPMTYAEEQHEEDDRVWITHTYTNQAINQDPYYQENLVIGDLPAGTYQINIPMVNVGLMFHHTIEIHPGQVTYFTFQLWDGFTTGQVPTSEVSFTPAP